MFEYPDKVRLVEDYNGNLTVLKFTKHGPGEEYVLRTAIRDRLEEAFEQGQKAPRPVKDKEEVVDERVR